MTTEKQKPEIKKPPYVISNAPIGSGQSTYSDENVLNYTKLTQK
jgi:hypothetical protein